MGKPATYRDGPRTPKSIEWYLIACGVSDTKGTREALQATLAAVAAAMNAARLSRAEAEELVRRFAYGTASAPEGMCDRPTRKSRKG